MVIYMWVLDLNNNYGNYDGTPVCVKAVDTAMSVIWARRFYEPGEFEIVIPADEEMFRLLTTEEIIFTRDEDDTVMYAEKIKLTTNAEDGDRITVSGRSIECWLDRRVVNARTNFENMQAEILLFNLIQKGFTLGYTVTRRHFPLIDLDLTTMRPYSGVTMTAEYFGENILDVAKTICRAVKAGLKFTMHEGTLAPHDGSYSYFTLGYVRGIDRSDTVIFSPEFGNLISTEYNRDKKGVFTTAYVYESKEKKDVVSDTIVEASETTGIPARDRILRKEAWISAQNGYTEKNVDVPSNGWIQGRVTNGTARPDPDAYSAYTSTRYKCENALSLLNVKIKDSVVEACKSEGAGIFFYLHCYDDEDKYIGYVYPDLGTGRLIYESINSSANKDIELLENTKYVRFQVYVGSPYDKTAPPLSEAMEKFEFTTYEHELYMQEQGERELTVQDKQETFFGEVIDNGLYTIGKDYDLGDIVKIENAYGISCKARVTEINEVEDGEGYRIMPEFSDITAEE